MTASRPLTLAEIAKHPRINEAVPRYKPVLKSVASVARNRRGGPISIAYEIYGHGPIHIVWIMGLGTSMFAWHRQVKYFGIDNADRFTCLTFDNRGIGESSVPLTRYTTTEMAKDALELCDHIGWTGFKQLHIVGISMGGMISQEIAYVAPERIASLTLESTAARLVATSPWYQHIMARASVIMPKTPEGTITWTKHHLFSEEWLAAPDALGIFPTNGDRFVAEDHWKRQNMKRSLKGFLFQAMAANWHHVSNARLKTIGSKVKHVLVTTGTADRMIHYTHSDVLVAQITAGGCAVKKRYFEGIGHCLNWEVEQEFNKLIEEFIAMAAADFGGVSNKL